MLALSNTTTIGCFSAFTCKFVALGRSKGHQIGVIVGQAIKVHILVCGPHCLEVESGSSISAPRSVAVKALDISLIIIF